MSQHGKLGAHLALLMPPLAALLYPFLLAAFHANIAKNSVAAADCRAGSALWPLITGARQRREACGSSPASPRSIPQRVQRADAC